jgi:hypothetical protein
MKVQVFIFLDVFSGVSHLQPGVPVEITGNENDIV